MAESAWHQYGGQKEDQVKIISKQLLYRYLSTKQEFFFTNAFNLGFRYRNLSGHTTSRWQVTRSKWGDKQYVELVRRRHAPAATGQVASKIGWGEATGSIPCWEVKDNRGCQEVTSKTEAAESRQATEAAMSRQAT